MKTTITLVTAILLGASALQAQQGPNRERKGPQQDKPDALEWVVEHEQQALELGITQEQIEKVKDVLLQSEKDSIDLRAEAEKAKLDFKSLMSADTPDKEAILASITASGNIQTELRKVRVTSQLAVREILGAEKMKEVRQAIRKSMKEQHQQFQQQRKEKRQQMNQGQGGPRGPMGPGAGGPPQGEVEF